MSRYYHSDDGDEEREIGMVTGVWWPTELTGGASVLLADEIPCWKNQPN
jgi:hypothetical protein